MKQLVLFFLILFTSTSIYSQWNSNTAINTPICEAFRKQKEVRFESDSKGGAFVVWKDYRDGSFFNVRPDIYIQRVDSNGYALWDYDGVGLCVLNSDQSTPAITTDKKGGVIVAWSDRRSMADRDIYAQRVDGNGNILWALNGVPVCNKPAREHSQKIISDDHSGIIVIWEQERIVGIDTSWDIWAQRIDSNGLPVWAVGGIPICLNDSNRINHKVQRDGDGGAIITFQDRRSGNYDIWAQHIDSNGTLLWGNDGIPVCIAPGNQTNPKIDPEKKADGVFIAWVDKRNGVDYDVYCNRIDSVGVALWGASGKPVVTAVKNQSSIDILSNNKTKGVIVSWKDKRTAGTKYDIYAQKLDMDGDPEWTYNGVVICSEFGHQKNPNIISDKHGGAIIVWQDARLSNNDIDIYGQRISYNGNTIWASNGIPIGTAAENQTGPKNIPDNKGGMIVVWEDKRGGFSKDIFIHHILIPDTVTYPVDTVVTPTAPPLITDTGTILVKGITFIENALSVNAFPNPFKDVINIEIDQKNQNSSLKFELVDALGRKFVEFESVINNDKYSLNLEKLGLNNGLYFLIIHHKGNSKSILFVKE